MSMKKGCLITIIMVLIVALVVIFAGDRIVQSVMRYLYPQSYSEIVEEQSMGFDLDKNLVYAVISAESKFDEDAVSSAGAVGLMQLTPGTFEWINEKIAPDSTPDIYNPRDNIRAGCALLRLLIDNYGNTDTALAAYNAGMGNVSSWLQSDNHSSDGISLYSIPYPETKAYVDKVNKNYDIYNNLYK